MSSEGLIYFDNCIYRLLFIQEDGEVYEPVYPFVESQSDITVLEEFVEQYREELTKHYTEGKRLYFSRSLFGFDTALKERFKERWFKRGLLID